MLVGKRRVLGGKFDNAPAKLRSTIYNNEVRKKVDRLKRDLRKSEVYNVEAVVARGEEAMKKGLLLLLSLFFSDPLNYFLFTP